MRNNKNKTNKENKYTTNGTKYSRMEQKKICGRQP